MTNTSRAWGLALAACVPLLATAQAAKSAPPKTAPQLTYRSAFADYKPYTDAPLGDWRELNAAVTGAGGHAGHGMADMRSMGGMEGLKGMDGMKRMEMPGAPAVSASAPTQMKPAPMTMPMTMHDGHQGKGDKP